VIDLKKLFFILLLSYIVYSGFFPSTQCAVITIQPVYMNNESINQTFIYTIYSDVNATCQDDFCEICSSKESIDFVLEAKNNETLKSRAYSRNIYYTGSSFDYYVFFFEYYGPTLSNSDKFGNGELTYLSNYQMTNGLECVVIIFLAIIIYVGYSYYKNKDKTSKLPEKKVSQKKTKTIKKRKKKRK